MRNSQTSGALWLGSGIHYALERFYGRGEPLIPAFKIWTLSETSKLLSRGIRPNTEAIAKTSELGMAMLQGYMQEYGEHPQDDPDFQVITAEQEFMVPIPNTDDGWLVGRIDGLVLEEASAVGTTSGAWVLDHKTTQSFPDDSDLQLVPQFTAYAWAATMLAREGAIPGMPPGTQIRGTVYNGLRKQMPTKNVTKPLFKRAWLPKWEATLASFQVHLAEWHNQMVLAKQGGDSLLFPTFSRQCGWCDFVEVCRAAEQADDYDYLLSTQFRKAERRGTVYAHPDDQEEA